MHPLRMHHRLLLPLQRSQQQPLILWDRKSHGVREVGRLVVLLACQRHRGGEKKQRCLNRPLTHDMYITRAYTGSLPSMPMHA